MKYQIFFYLFISINLLSITPMNIWGKFIGGAAGFALGGPLGALIGALAGHAVDKVAPIKHKDNDITKSLAFTAGIIALSAKMAKADGFVSQEEISTFKKLVEIPPENINTVGKLWELAKQTTDGYESYANQIASLFPHGSPVLEKLIDLLFEIAKSDGVIKPEEELYLKNVASIFRINEKSFQRLLDFHENRENPFSILGVNSKDSDEKIKSAWKSLVIQNHPDHLIGQGMPKEFIISASQRLADINSAYDKIKNKRLAKVKK